MPPRRKIFSPGTLFWLDLSGYPPKLLTRE
jgi:hypothetical protein